MSFTMVLNRVEILLARPSVPNEEIFNKGIPVAGTTNQSAALILFTPKLQSIGSIDNTNSDASTTYGRQVATGFTTTESVALTVETSVEATVEFIKASFRLSTTVTFTQESSKLTTETVEFSVPAGKKAFTYQGYMFMEKMFYNANNRTYTWSGIPGRCLTNALTTTRQILPPDGQ